MKDLSQITTYLSERTGIDPSSLGLPRWDGVVVGFMHAHGLPTPTDCLRLLHQSAQARDELIEAVMVHETWFFRSPQSFHCLRDYAQRILRSGVSRLRVLCAPCCTGEEPYSVAITLMDAGLSPRQIHIDAADISLSALTFAKEALYGSRSFREEQAAKYEAYFRMENGKRRLKNKYRKLVQFYRDNIVSPTFMTEQAPYSIIFCRNLLIYLTDSARYNLLKNLRRLLTDNGILFVGHAEMVVFNKDDFIDINYPRAFACRRKHAIQKKQAAKIQTKLSRKSVSYRSSSKRESDSHRAINAGESMPGELCKPEWSVLDEVRVLADSGDTDAAAKLCQSCLHAHPDKAEAHYLMGMIHQAQGQDEPMLKHMQQALYLQPDHYPALVQMSLYHLGEGNIEKAGVFRRRAERVHHEGRLSA